MFSLQHSRFGKRAMDNRNFFGGILHVCYAPEFESMEETRAKLAQRRRDVAKRTKLNEGAGEKSNQHDNSGASAAAKASTSPPQAPCVWAGTPYSRDPRSITASRIVPSEAVLQPFGPQPPDEEWIRAGVRERRIIASHPHALRPAFSAHTPVPTPPPEPTPVPTLAPASMTSRSALPHTTPAATATVPDTKLTKFVPRQLKVKAVVFRKNRRQRHGDE